MFKFVSELQQQNYNKMKRLLLVIGYIAMCNTITAQQNVGNYKRPVHSNKVKSNQVITVQKPEFISLKSYKSFTKTKPDTNLINVTTNSIDSNKIELNPLKSNGNYKTKIPNTILKNSENDN
jgi:hypothetical protein